MGVARKSKSKRPSIPALKKLIRRNKQKKEKKK